VILDGKEITGCADINKGGIRLERPGTLRDGPHYISAQLKHSLLFSRMINLEWSFNVDSEAPYIDLGVGNIWGSRESNAEVSGLTEPGARITARLNGTRLTDPAVYGGGTFYIKAHIGSGSSLLQLEAVDQAGNKTHRNLRLVLDKEPPVLIGPVSPLKNSLKTATPVIEASVEEKDSEIHGVSLKINGQKMRGYYDPGEKKVKAEDAELAEGNNKIEMMVEDTAGNVASANWSCLIDSTEEFGKRNLVGGAVGADVRELQARLSMHGFKSGRPTSSYNSDIVQAVKGLQETNGIPVSGVVGPEELRILKPQKLDTTKPIAEPRLVIEISKKALHLYSGDNLVKVYPIAVGRGGRFKTPVGQHKIRKKIVNPTWYPPAWAGIDHPIRPGPNNPLGNREMKLSKKGYSIHGTNRPMSIGNAATHGCIRMYPSDVMELFEIVNVGTPVEIRS
jgi:hypothetical protein